MGGLRRTSQVHTPNPTGFLVGKGQEYRFFSEDLSLGVLEPRGPFAPLAACTATGCVRESFPEDTEQTVYVRHNSTCQSEIATCYTPLLTAAKGYADVQPGTEFGGGVSFVDATPDGKHVVVGTDTSLGAVEWSATAPATDRLRSLPAVPAGTSGSSSAIPARALSADGERVFWGIGRSLVCDRGRRR